MSIQQQATDHAAQHATNVVGSKLATGMTYGGLVRVLRTDRGAGARPTPVAIDI